MMAMRDHGCKVEIAELNEELFFSAPTSSTDKSPMGLPFWIIKDVTTPEGAFQTGNPSGFSSGRAEIDSGTVTRWRNWAYKHTSVTVDDFVRKTKKAMYKTRFRPPVPHPELAFGKAMWTIITTYAVREPLERIAETRNDNLGNDVAKYINNVLLGGVPVEASHYLDENDTTDPAYGVCWKSFRPFVQRGKDMRQTKVRSGNQHTVWRVHYDTWMNYTCENLREQFVGSTA